MGVEPSYADEAVAILITAFGQAWLREVAEDTSPSLPLPFRRHPLGDIISTAGEAQLAEALEIAEYLKQVAELEQLPALISGLKGQFYQTLLQLAFAARLRLAGATGLTLEPDSLAGRSADIDFTIGDLRVRAECYRPTVQGDRELGHEVIRIAQKCLDVAKTRPGVFSIAIDLRATPNAAVRRMLVGQVRRMVEEIARDVERHPNTFPTIVASGDVAELCVARAIPTPPGSPPRLVVSPAFSRQERNFEIFMRQGWARKERAKGIFGEPDSATGMSHVAIWLPPGLSRREVGAEDVEAELVRLGKRVERKLVQARAAEKTIHRLLIVDSWVAPHLSRIGAAVLERLRAKLLDAHENVIGILFVHREWREDLGRHAYAMYALQPKGRVGIPNALLESLAAIDQR